VVAVDTNVVVRLVVADHAAQAARAAAIFRSGRVFIAKSVLLETEWVLRYSYKLATGKILAAFRGVLGLNNVAVEDPTAVATALRLLDQGFDFADALHLASSAQAERFATFDASLVKRSKRTDFDVVLAAIKP
jgi:predicted nucleic-acid-binding protein